MQIHTGDPQAIHVTRVTIDGEDVTKRCFMADDAACLGELRARTEGVVGLYKLGEDGELLAHRCPDCSESHVAKERRYGKVEITFRDGAADS